MRFRKIILSVFLVLAGQVAISQTFEMPENPDDFGLKAQENLTTIGTESAILIATEFEQLWRGYGQDVRTKIISQSVMMVDKHYGIRDYFLPYFNCLVLAAHLENLESDKLLTLVNTTGSVIENESPKSVRNYFGAIQTFFEDRALYFSESSKLIVKNDSYTFEYHGSALSDDNLFAELDEEASDDEYYEDNYDDEEYSDDEYDEYDEYEDDEDDPYYDDPYYDDEDDEYYDDDYDDYDEEDFENDDFVLGEDLEYFPDPAPPLEGPVISFFQLDLDIQTRQQTAYIKKTKGSYIINSHVFSGEDGSFDWMTDQLDSGETALSIDLNIYNFDIRRPELSGKVVKLHHPEISATPIEGEFRYNGGKSGNRFSFISYKSDISYKKFGESGIQFTGGLSLKGSRIFSTAKQPRSSNLFVSQGGNKKFQAMGRVFEIGDSLMISPSSSVTIYHGTDSIYHQSASIRYNPKSNELLVISDDGDFRYSPFFSSYTNMDITTDMIRWDLDSDSLEMSILSGKTELPTIFQSLEYYNPEVLDVMSKNYDFNPLTMVVNYVRKERDERFYAADVAGYYEVDVKEVQNALLELAQWGYLNYYRDTKTFSLRKKARHYYSAKRGSRDFDNLLILSNVDKGVNAVFDLENAEMHINGIEKFFISEVLDVYIEPDSNQITLGKDRNFKFDGKLIAGNFEYVGSDFQFNYDSFLIDLNRIERIQFYVLDEKTGKKRAIDNVISGINPEDSLSGIESSEMEGTKGRLYVNKPNNKSGKKIFPNFPNFEGSGSGSIVYFSGREYLDGVYDKSMYFILPPFELDSLSDSDPTAINFEGDFHSENVFPSFSEKLHIMEDQTLGFDHSIPPDGYKLFNGDGTLYDRVSLDSRGLVGAGKLEYLTSVMNSEKYTFYPDSLVAEGTDFLMTNGLFEGANFPQMQVQNFHMQWLPYTDSMYITPKNQELITLYDGLASFNGQANVTHSGVYGKGEMFSLGTRTVSDDFKFGSEQIGARHADFVVASSDPEKPALTGTDIRLNIDLLSKEAEINPEIEGTAALSFPYAQFNTSIPSAIWDIDSNKVVMTKPADVDIKYSYFYTTREDLDSLAFNADRAEYDMNTQELKVSGIPHIQVADALITPENGEVLILENARIGTLLNTTLVIDTLYGYHNLYDGTIDIISRNEFGGSATYQLVNAVSDTFAIEMTNFRLEAVESDNKRLQEFQTVANGTVIEDNNILISPGIYYRGDIIMKARQPALELDGFVKLDLKNVEFYSTWISYSSSADQGEVIFSFDDSRTEFDERLNAGLHFDYNDYSLYNTFIYKKRDPTDEDFFVPSGLVSFQKDSSEYLILEESKSLGLTYEGRSFVYNENDTTVRFEGPVNFVENGKDITIEAAVIGNGNFATSDYYMKSFMALDFDIPGAIYNFMATDILLAVEQLGALDAVSDRTSLIYNLANMIGDRAAKNYESFSQEEYTPLTVMSPALNRPLVISEVEMKWEEDQKAFYNLNSKIGVSNILKSDINATLESFFEIQKTVDGDIIKLFLKASPETWFYFGYEADKLLIYSSNKEMNDYINSKSNQGKAKIGEMVFGLGDRGETLDFINSFRQIYYGIEEPYELSGEVEQKEKEKEVVSDDDDDGF